MPYSCYRPHQLQPARDAIGLTSSPTLQLDLTQQLDTRQHGAAEDDCNPSSSQWPSLLIQEEEHPAADSDAVMHASTASQPVCIDHPNDCRQHLLARSTTYHQPSSCLEGSSLRADPMQHRALSGFLTPLGKLAGMFGWTPGKPNRPWDRPQMSQATIPLDHVHMHNGKQHLTGLARPASASAVSQEVSASLFQVKPQHLTMQQLQDLQKAADLLSPRSMLGARGMEHSPSHAIVSSSMRHPDAQAVVLAASSMTGDASGLVAGECIKQNMFPQPRDHIRGHVPATSDSRLRSQIAAEPNGSPGAGPDSSSSLAKTAAKVGWDSHVAGMTPDDDDSLAAALAARLGMMAPCISSLYGTVHAPCAIGANNCQQQDQEHTLKRNRGEEMDTSQQGLMHVTDFGVAQQADIVPLAGRHDHDVQHMLQKPPPDHTVHARKRFRRTTGLEVLQRCMPALWQNRKELHQ